MWEYLCVLGQAGWFQVWELEPDGEHTEVEHQTGSVGEIFPWHLHEWNEHPSLDTVGKAEGMFIIS